MLLLLIVILFLFVRSEGHGQESTGKPRVYVEWGRFIPFLVPSVALTPDSRRVVTANYDGTIKVWDLERGVLIRALGTYPGAGYPLADSARAVTVTPDGKRIVSANLDSLRHEYMVKVWDIESGRILHTLRGHTLTVDSVAVTPDGRRAISGSFDNAVGVWDIESGVLHKMLKGHKAPIDSVTVTPDSRRVVSGSGDGTVKVWDIESGKALRTLKHRASDDISGVEVAVTPDGRRVVSAGTLVKVWDIESGKLLRTLKDAVTFDVVAVTPDGRHIVTGSDGMYVTPEGRRTAGNGFGADAGIIKVWDIESGKLLNTLRGHTKDVMSLAITSDSKRVVSGSRDGTTRYWDLSSGKELLQFISFFGSEWVSLIPEGYYSASPQGDEYLKVSVGDSVYGIEQFRSTFYKPEVVAATLHLRDSGAAIAGRVGDGAPTIEAVASFLPPVISITSPADGQQVNGLLVELSLTIEDRNHPLKSVQVFVNQHRTATTRTRGWGTSYQESVINLAEGQKRLDLSRTLQLQLGENVIKVVAANAYAETPSVLRVVAARPTVEAEASAVRPGGLPQLWILSIGVNDTPQLSGKLPKLSFAAADSEAFVRKFKEQEGRLFSKVNALVINDSPSKEIEGLARDKGAAEIRKISSPTFENIADNLRYLRSARSGDYVMLFVAGHAVSDEGAYYFMPSDAALNDDGSVKRSRAVSWTDIKDALYLLNVRVWAFLDTCHAADVVGRVKTADTNYLIKELQDSALVFASSTGAQTSVEGTSWGHGAFTYALLQGLGGKADHLRDGTIMMSELESYVTKLVTKETGERQTPVLYPKAFQDIPIFRLGK